MIRTFDKRYRGEHPMFAIEPAEIDWCEDCGSSRDFCECNTALNFEDEREEV